MVAGTAITLEAGSAPDFVQTSRQAFRAAVDQVSVKAKATLPESSGRVDKAVQIVLQGEVEILPDGHARVASQCQGSTQYGVAAASIGKFTVVGPGVAKVHFLAK